MPCEFLTDSFKLVRKSFPPVFGPFFSPPSFPLAKLEAIILFTCGLNMDLLVHPFLCLPGLGVLGVVAGRGLGVLGNHAPLLDGWWLQITFCIWLYVGMFVVSLPLQCYSPLRTGITCIFHTDLWTVVHVIGDQSLAWAWMSGVFWWKATFYSHLPVQGDFK